MKYFCKGHLVDITEEGLRHGREDGLMTIFAMGSWVNIKTELFEKLYTRVDDLYLQLGYRFR